MTCNNWNYRKPTGGGGNTTKHGKENKQRMSAHLVTHLSCSGKDLRITCLPLQCKHRQMQVQKLTELYAKTLHTSPCGSSASVRNTTGGWESLRSGKRLACGHENRNGIPEPILSVWLFCSGLFVCLFFKRPAVVTQVCNPSSGEVRTVPSEAQERLSQRRGVLTWGTTLGLSSELHTNKYIHAHSPYKHTNTLTRTYRKRE